MSGDPFASIAPFYDWEHEGFQDDIPFYRGFARHCSGAVLELACGTGRILAPLAREGVDIVGVDQSEAMLECARARLDAAALPPCRAELVRADLVDFSLARQFSLALVALDSFGLLVERADQQRALARAHAHIVPGGLLLLDVANGSLKFGDPSQEWVHQRTAPFGSTGEVLSKFVAREADASEQLERFTYFYDLMRADGSLSRTIASLELRYFTRFELELLLEQAGFQVEALYGSYELEQFGPLSERLIAVARRP